MIISHWKKLFFTHIVPTLFFGGDSSSPTQTTSTVTQSSVPDWLRPQTESLLGAATQQIFNTTPNAGGGLDVTGITGYKPYSTNASDYVAGFSPMQQQSYYGAANMQMPNQFGTASNLTTLGGYGGIDSATNAMNYGTQGAGYGGQAAGLAGQGLGYQTAGQNLANQASGYGSQAATAGQNYVNAATNPNVVQAFMSPYQQSVTDVAKQGALRDFQTAQTMRQANATKAGAFGGARQGIENAEAQRNLSTQLQNLDVQGRQNAFTNAQQQQQFAANLGLQGLQQANTGVNTAIGAQGLGLSGLGAANQAYQTGITGANAGLAGVQQAQAGYGLGTSAGTALSNIGTQQQAAQQGIYNLQNAYGQQQTQQQQDIINNAINNYAMAQQYPMQQLAAYNALLRGYAQPVTSTQNYAAAPSAISQFGGLAATGLGAYMASKKEGGKIDEPKKYAGGGLVDLAIANAMGEA